ncbi:MAG TPA: hypothetical protein V6C65_22345 [Allocoleopsis sp.]
MTSRAQQEEYLASVAQAFDAGDYDFLPPDKMQALNSLIAAAWKTFREGGEVDAQLNQIQQMIHPH